MSQLSGVVVAAVSPPPPPPPPTPSKLLQNEPRLSAEAHSGPPRKDYAKLAERAARAAAELLPALRHSVAARQMSAAERAARELDALRVADGARDFMADELPGKIELAFDSGSVRAFGALCDEAALRGAALGRPYFFEAALSGKGALLRHMCARTDSACAWPGAAALGAPPLAVLLLLAAAVDEPHAAHLYDSIATLAGAGFVFATDMPTMVVCTQSVAQWQFVRRLFGEFAERVALAAFGLLHPCVRRHIERNQAHKDQQ